MKITALHGGGDWYDASAEYLIVPEGIDLETEKAAWRVWYQTIYCPALKTNRVQFITFAQWLIARGARLATDDEIEIFDDV